MDRGTWRTKGHEVAESPTGMKVLGIRHEITVCSFLFIWWCSIDNRQCLLTNCPCPSHICSLCWTVICGKAKWEIKQPQITTVPQYF